MVRDLFVGHNLRATQLYLVLLLKKKVDIHIALGKQEKTFYFWLEGVNFLFKFCLCVDKGSFGWGQLVFGATLLGIIDEEEDGPPYYMWSCQRKLFCLC